MQVTQKDRNKQKPLQIYARTFVAHYTLATVHSNSKRDRAELLCKKITYPERQCGL